MVKDCFVRTDLFKETCKRLEEQNAALKDEVNEIKTNHLPHLAAKVDKIVWLLVVTSLGIAVSIGLQLLS